MMLKIDFCKNWNFRKFESSEPWRNIVVPHDAMIEEARNPECESGSAGAYFPGGTYEYNKTFYVPAEWMEKKTVIEFEGVYQNAVIQLNNEEIGKIDYGYTEKHFDLSSHLKYGEQNQISVIVDNHEQPNSRWYTGSGIYRPVNLYVMEKGGIPLHGIKIRTLSYHPAKIEVTVSHEIGNVEIHIMDHDTEVTCVPGDHVEITIPHARLWNADTPNLYLCRARLLNEEQEEMDIQETSFGIRLLEWSSDGFFVNGNMTLLKGGCLHHDNGILGACAYAESEERRVRILKENGFNAIRSAHNPCSRAMLNACDKLGMYVIDETWDIWYQHKSKYDYAEKFRNNYRDDLQAMIQKDYNHPSVIFYSIGNEVSEPAKPEGMKLANELIDFCHELDDSRAVTAGLNLMIVANAAKGQELYQADGGGVNYDSAENLGDGVQQQGMPDLSHMDSTMFNMITQHVGCNMNHAADSAEADAATSPILDALDIAGYNYASGRYPLEGAAHPDRIVFGSETFPQEIGENWNMVKKYPYLIGDFMWTAMDYLGEAGIGAWSYTDDAITFNKPYPWITGGAGVIDLIGNPDGEALYAKTVWSDTCTISMAVTPANHPGVDVIKSSWRGTNAIPSWSWKNCEGNPVSVEVYTNAYSVKLFVDHHLIGEAITDNCKAAFDLFYQPGELTAVGFDESGNALCDCSLTSAKQKLRVRIQPEKKNVATDEVVYFPIAICDDNDIVESNADDTLHISVEGGQLLGFGSANPRTEESYLTCDTQTYYGRCLAVVRKTENQLKISVDSEKHGFDELMI